MNNQGLKMQNNLEDQELVEEKKNNKWIKPVSAGVTAAALIGIGATVIAIKSRKESGPEQDRREGGESNGGTPSPIAKTKEECAKMLEEYSKKVEGGSTSTEDLDNLREEGLKHCKNEFQTYLKGKKGKKDLEGNLVNDAADQSKKTEKDKHAGGPKTNTENSEGGIGSGTG